MEVVSAELLSDCWNEVFSHLANHAQGYMTLSSCSKFLLRTSENKKSIKQFLQHTFDLPRNSFMRVGIPILSRYHHLKDVKIFLRSRQTWAVLVMLKQTTDFGIPKIYDLQNMLACELLKEQRYLTRPFRSKILEALRDVDILPGRIYRSFNDESTAYILCAKRFLNGKLTRRIRNSVGIAGVLVMVEVPIYFLAMILFMLMDYFLAPSIGIYAIATTLALLLRYIFAPYKEDS